MTATERLRQLLDERGVEWWNDTDPEPQHVTVVHFEERIVIYHENVNGTMGYHVYNTHDLTPEQAVEATLGRGTCEVDATIKWDWDRCEPYWEHELSCGHTVTTMEPEPPAFCPECGRRVEE